jgi:hypothetical protein
MGVLGEQMGDSEFIGESEVSVNTGTFERSKLRVMAPGSPANDAGQGGDVPCQAPPAPPSREPDPTDQDDTIEVWRLNLAEAPPKGWVALSSPLPSITYGGRC